MRAENGKGRPRQGDLIPNNVQNLDRKQATTRQGQKPVATPVIASAHGVVGGTGRHRWLLLFRCPCCGAHHVAHGRGDLPASLERPAACGRGRLCILPALSRIGGVA